MGRPLNPERLGLILSVTASVLFGIYPAAIRAVYADGGNAAFMIITTTWARALGLLFYCLLKRKPMFQTWEETKQGVIGGFFQAFSICGILAALTLMPGPLVIIVIFTHTLMLLFFLIWKGEVKLDAPTLVTTLSALAGLSLVLDIWHKQSTANLWGITLAFAAAIATVLRLYVYGHQTRERNPAVVGAENFLTAALFVLLILFFKAPHAPASLHGYGWVFLSCVSIAVATFNMFYGISLIGSFRWSLFAKLEPIFTSLFSMWFIHEILKPYQYLGIAIVVTGLVLYQTVFQPRKVTAIETE